MKALFVSLTAIIIFILFFPMHCTAFEDDGLLTLSNINENESTAIKSLKEYFASQHAYSSRQEIQTFNNVKFLAEGGFIDMELGSAIDSRGVNALSGYVFSEALECDEDGICSKFELECAPENYNKSGVRQFYMCPEGVIWTRDAGDSGLPAIVGTFPGTEDLEKAGWSKLQPEPGLPL